MGTRGRDEFGALFDGLELVGPGIVPASEWRPGGDGPVPDRAEINVWAGVGREP